MPDFPGIDERLFGLSLFWKEVSYNFAYFDHVPNLNWDQTYREYIPKVMAVETLFEYYRILQRFCALLKDGHTNVYMPPQFSDYMDSPKIRLNEVQHRAIVTNIGKTLEGEIPIGSEIIEVEGMPISQYLEVEIFPYISSSTEYILWSTGVWRLLEGIRGSSVTVKLCTPHGITKEVQLTRNSAISHEGWLKEEIQFDKPFEFKWLDERIAYVFLGNFNDEQIVDEFKKCLPELFRCNGVILDIRANNGGSTDIADKILDHFTDEPLTGSTWRTREHRAAFKAWGSFADLDAQYEQYLPYHENNAWYSGKAEILMPTAGKKIKAPIVILTGYYTASAAEDFLIYLDKAPNVVKIGQPTFGSTGQPLSFNMPGGGRARICTKRDTYPDGRDFVGYGIQPDIRIDPSVEDVINNRDITLEKGIAVLKEKITLFEQLT